MIAPERENLLRLVTELSAADPHLRFGQMIANLATLAQSAVPDSIWHAEDDEFAGAAQRLLKHYRQDDEVVA